MDSDILRLLVPPETTREPREEEDAKGLPPHPFPMKRPLAAHDGEILSVITGGPSGEQWEP